MRGVMLTCIPLPSSVLGCASQEPPPPPAPWLRPAILYFCPRLALHAHSPYTVGTLTEPAAAANVPARRVDRGNALLCRTGGWRDVRAPSRLPLPRRSLRDNDLGDDAKQAFRAAARSGLQLWV